MADSKESFVNEALGAIDFPRPGREDVSQRIRDEARRRDFGDPQELVRMAQFESQINPNSIRSGRASGADMMGLYQYRRSLSDGFDPLDIEQATAKKVDEFKRTGLTGYDAYLPHNQGPTGAEVINQWREGSGPEWNNVRAPGGAKIDLAKNLAYQSGPMKSIIPSPPEMPGKPDASMGARRSAELKRMLRAGEITEQDLGSRFYDAQKSVFDKRAGKAPKEDPILKSVGDYSVKQLRNENREIISSTFSTLADVSMGHAIGSTAATAGAVGAGLTNLATESQSPVRKDSP